MLANSSKYAIKALRYLVLYSSESNKILVKDIARETDVPKAFLSKLLQQLSAASFVSSLKGPFGGFFLTEEQLQASILDVIVEIEGRDKLKQCALNFENCNETNPCPIHFLIATEKEALHEKLRRVRVSDLVSEY